MPVNPTVKALCEQLEDAYKKDVPGFKHILWPLQDKVQPHMKATGEIDDNGDPVMVLLDIYELPHYVEIEGLPRIAGMVMIPIYITAAPLVGDAADAIVVLIRQAVERLISVLPPDN